MPRGAIFAMIGIAQFQRSRAHAFFDHKQMNIRQFRKLHQTVAPIVLFPLFVTVCTGVTYRLAKSWFGSSRDQVHWLMVMHEGEYLGPILEPFYVLLNGLGLLWMLITGGMMVWQNISKSKWVQQLRPIPSAPASNSASNSASTETNSSQD